MTRDPDCIPPVPTEEGGELKPCPLCNGNNIQHVPGQLIACMNINCGCMVEIGSPWGGPKEDGIAFLISVWNTRPTQTPQDVAPIKRTMTINLTDEEMAALDKLAAEKALEPPSVFRHALKVYQLWSLPTDHPARIDWARQHALSAPQDVAGLVEAVARAREEITVARLHGRDRPYIAIRTLDAETILSALRASPIGHETSTSAENARVAQPHLVLAAADNNHETAVPDFLKRQTGELPPVTFPTWRDDGREGSREGAEEDPDNNHKALVEALRFYAVSGEDGEVARQALASLTTKEGDRG